MISKSQMKNATSLSWVDIKEESFRQEQEGGERISPRNKRVENEWEKRVENEWEKRVDHEKRDA